MGCFVAGTLIWTDQGQKPIEQVNVGDLVLSQPENGGERVYKRVVNTFRHEQQEVFLLQFLDKEELEVARIEGRLMRPGTRSFVVATGNHPFWIKDMDWMRADSLGDDDNVGFDGNDVELELIDGRSTVLDRVQIVRRTSTEGIGWVPGASWFDEGTRIDLRNNTVVVGYPGERVTNDVHWRLPDNTFRCTVYNLEVEDTHTYYVGDFGVWVHNSQRRHNLAGLEIVYCEVNG
jgi:intein/homing endonuclease